jgi:hypothetical protein
MNKNQKQIRAKLKALRRSNKPLQITVPVRNYAEVVEKMGPGPVPGSAFTSRTF